MCNLCLSASFKVNYYFIMAIGKSEQHAEYECRQLLSDDVFKCLYERLNYVLQRATPILYVSNNRIIDTKIQCCNNWNYWIFRKRNTQKAWMFNKINWKTIYIMRLWVYKAALYKVLKIITKLFYKALYLYIEP